MLPVLELGTLAMIEKRRKINSSEFSPILNTCISPVLESTAVLGAVAKRSNHRLLRCSSLRVPGSMPGLAHVKVSIKVIYILANVNIN